MGTCDGHRARLASPQTGCTKMLILKGGVPPYEKTNLLGAEADQLVFYSEFFFFKAYHDFLIRVRATNFVLD